MTLSVPYGYSYETGHTALWYTNKTRESYGSKVKGITIHHWGSLGSSFNGIAYDWFCKNNDRRTSANYVAQGADANGTIAKRVACIVDPDLIAWHAGVWQANVDTIGIECRPEARDVDYQVVAELVARLWITYGDVPLYPHKHWVTTDCPGRWDLNKLATMAKAKKSQLIGTIMARNITDDDVKAIADAVWSRKPWGDGTPGNQGVPNSSAANNMGWQSFWTESVKNTVEDIQNSVNEIKRNTTPQA